MRPTTDRADFTVCKRCRHYDRSLSGRLHCSIGMQTVTPDDTCHLPAAFIEQCRRRDSEQEDGLA
jgi:hypothetical protein